MRRSATEQAGPFAGPLNRLPCPGAGVASLASSGAPQRRGRGAAVKEYQQSVTQWLLAHEAELERLAARVQALERERERPARKRVTPQPARAREAAEAVVRELLADGRRPAREVLAAARGRGVSARTCQRAVSALGVVREPEGEAWYWRLPPAPDEPEAERPESSRSTNPPDRPSGRSISRSPE